MEIALEVQGVLIVSTVKWVYSSRSSCGQPGALFRSPLSFSARVRQWVLGVHSSHMARFLSTMEHGMCAASEAAGESPSRVHLAFRRVAEVELCGVMHGDRNRASSAHISLTAFGPMLMSL